MSDRKASARGVTMEVSKWVSGLQASDIPESTRCFLRHALLDTLGCGLHGRSQPWTEIAEGWVREGGGSGLSTVWGDRGPSLRASDAAMITGIATHAFELDDFHQTKQHPGAVVIPAALAVGEKVDASGEALLTSIAAGYEVMNPFRRRDWGWRSEGARMAYHRHRGGHLARRRHLRFCWD